MITLSHAQCIEATKDGFFSVPALKMTAPLTLDDLAFLTEYLRITPLHGIDLSLEITRENVAGLFSLSHCIERKSELKKLTFGVTELPYTKPKDEDEEEALDSLGDLIDLFTHGREKKMNNMVLDAMVKMVNNKPNLQKITISLGKLSTNASSYQAQRMANAISQSPITSMNFDLSVIKGSKLPFLAKQPKAELTHFQLYNCFHGTDALRTLQTTRSLKTLIIEGMQLSVDDLDLLDAILQKNPALVMLVLSKTNLGQLTPTPLIDKLKQYPNITCLDLSDDCLSRFDMDAICEYLSSISCTLTELDLSKNAFMGRDIVKITDALYSNKNVEKIVLDRNYIEDEGLQAVVKVLKYNHRIQMVSLSHVCRVIPSDESIDAMCALLRDPDCKLLSFSFYQKLSMDQLKKLAYAISDNKSLMDVRLNYNLPAIEGKFYKAVVDLRLYGNTVELLDEQTESAAQIDGDPDAFEESTASMRDSFFSALSDEDEEEQSTNEVSMAR